MVPWAVDKVTLPSVCVVTQVSQLGLYFSWENTDGMRHSSSCSVPSFSLNLVSLHLFPSNWMFSGKWATSVVASHGRIMTCGFLKVASSLWKLGELEVRWWMCHWARLLGLRLLLHRTCDTRASATTLLLCDHMLQVRVMGTTDSRPRLDLSYWGFSCLLSHNTDDVNQ